jgi:uncharacterized membrane protein YphA (DoxX/SURF4 family)
MNDIASILILILLALTFLQSAYDKIFAWQDNLDWLKGHFSKTFLKNMVPLALLKILILELLAGVLCLAGVVQMFLYDITTAGYYGAILSCITLIMLLFGQRIAKDYDGARTIVIYFIPAIMAVYWLG